MPSTAAIRLQIETTLANRVPAALTLKIKQAPELFPTGINEVDAILGGGVPRGSITEVAGAASTGKTSFGLSAIAAITQSGAACAWVDVSDALSPESAAAANIVLKRLLWLRMSTERKQKITDKPWSRLEQALKATDLLLQTGGSEAVVRQCFNNIRAITKLAKRQKYLSEDPGEDTKMPQTKSAEKPVMLREQILSLIGAITDLHDLCLLYIGIFCGPRSSEVFGFQWASLERRVVNAARDGL